MLHSEMQHAFQGVGRLAFVCGLNRACSAGHAIHNLCSYVCSKTQEGAHDAFEVPPKLEVESMDIREEDPFASLREEIGRGPVCVSSEEGSDGGSDGGSSERGVGDASGVVGRGGISMGGLGRGIDVGIFSKT